MPDKIKPVEVWLYRAEGPGSQADREITLTGDDLLSRAYSVLWQWSHTAPKGGGYDKCDFKITFADGETYKGRYDLKNPPDESLLQHVLGFLEFYSGRKKSEWMLQVQYDAVLAWQGEEAARASSTW